MDLKPAIGIIMIDGKFLQVFLSTRGKSIRVYFRISLFLVEALKINIYLETGIF